MSRPKLTKYPSRGYSLVELLTVLAIVGVLALVGVTSLGSKSPRAVKGTTSNVKALLQEARGAAQSRGLYILLNLSWDETTKAHMVGRVCDASGTILKNSDGATEMKAIDTLLSRSAFRHAKLVASEDSLPDKSIQSLEATKNFGFGPTSDGWDNSLVGSSTFAFSPTGALVKFTTSGGSTTVTPLAGLWVGVVGLSPNDKGVPYGVVMVSEQGQIMAFFKPDSQHNEVPTPDEYRWQRLE